MEQVKNRAFFGTTWKKFLAFNKEHALIQPGDRILALVSGGPDSTALACWLALLSKRVPFEWGILHFNHGLRAASEKEAQSVRKLASRLGVPFYTENIEVAKLAQEDRRSLEDAGRKLRYEAAEALARKERFNKAAVGHTLNEQAESVLINILRGGALKGLKGASISRPVFKGSKIRLIRPMLGVLKEEALAYLKTEGIKYHQDPSNRDPRFLRSRVRHELLPKLKELHPRAVEHFAGIALAMEKN